MEGFDLKRYRYVAVGLVLCVALLILSGEAVGARTGKTDAEEPALRSLLKSPLLFVKRHNYLGLHIYDTYYKWRPGGGIYILENPWAPQEKQVIRPLIDASTL